MPKSKVRRRSNNAPRGRNKSREVRARETQAAQRQAEDKQVSLASYRRRRIVGWTMVVLAPVVFVQHLVSHADFFTLISPGWDDLVAGYPLAFLLGIGGAIVLSRE